jgi:hypothetical protein
MFNQDLFQLGENATGTPIVTNQASSTCVEIDASTTACDYYFAPLVVQDSGDVIFMLGLVLFCCAFSVVGLYLNTFTKVRK